MARIAGDKPDGEDLPVGETPSRRFRYPEGAWREVQAQAAADRRSASAAIRAFLDAYRTGELRFTPDGRISVSDKPKVGIDA